MKEKTTAGDIYDSSGGWYKMFKIIHTHYMRLPDFGHYELAVYAHILSFRQDQESVDGSKIPNGLQGLSYPTKARLIKELRIGKSRLNETIERLRACGLIQIRTVENKKGGGELMQYRAVRLPDREEFMKKWGHLIEEKPQHDTVDPEEGWH